MRVLSYLIGTGGMGLHCRRGGFERLVRICRCLAHELSRYKEGKGNICVYMWWGSCVMVGSRVGSDSLSSCETEYMRLTLATQEASYLGILKGKMEGVRTEEKGKCI